MPPRRRWLPPLLPLLWRPPRLAAGQTCALSQTPRVLYSSTAVIGQVTEHSGGGCCAACGSTAGCNLFTWREADHGCTLMASAAGQLSSVGYISGARDGVVAGCADPGDGGEAALRADVARLQRRVDAARDSCSGTTGDCAPEGSLLAAVVACGTMFVCAGGGLAWSGRTRCAQCCEPAATAGAVEVVELHPEPPIGRLAPEGLMTMCFTDIQGSTNLWESLAPAVVGEALFLHDACMRELIEAHYGFEVKTEGDAFMVAFDTALHAARWCCAVQHAMLESPWPEQLLASDNPVAETRVEEKDGGGWLWRGMRVRMGFHTGEPICVVSPVTGRMDYFGAAVNMAARVQGAAFGGQIFASDAAVAQLKLVPAEEAGAPPPTPGDSDDAASTPRSPASEGSGAAPTPNQEGKMNYGQPHAPLELSFAEFRVFRHADPIPLKGFTEPCQMHAVVPRGLEARRFLTKKVEPIIVPGTPAMESSARNGGGTPEVPQTPNFEKSNNLSPAGKHRFLDTSHRMGQSHASSVESLARLIEGSSPRRQDLGASKRDSRGSMYSMSSLQSAGQFAAQHYPQQQQQQYYSDMQPMYEQQYGQQYGMYQQQTYNPGYQSYGMMYQQGYQQMQRPQMRGRPPVQQQQQQQQPGRPRPGWGAPQQQQGYAQQYYQQNMPHGGYDQGGDDGMNQSGRSQQSLGGMMLGGAGNRMARASVGSVHSVNSSAAPPQPQQPVPQYTAPRPRTYQPQRLRPQHRPSNQGGQRGDQLPGGSASMSSAPPMHASPDQKLPSSPVERLPADPRARQGGGAGSGLQRPKEPSEAPPDMTSQSVPDMDLGRINSGASSWTAERMASGGSRVPVMHQGLVRDSSWTPTTNPLPLPSNLPTSLSQDAGLFGPPSTAWGGSAPPDGIQRVTSQGSEMYVQHVHVQPPQGYGFPPQSQQQQTGANVGRTPPSSTTHPGDGERVVQMTMTS